MFTYFFDVPVITLRFAFSPTAEFAIYLELFFLFDKVVAPALVKSPTLKLLVLPVTLNP